MTCSRRTAPPPQCYLLHNTPPPSFTLLSIPSCSRAPQLSSTRASQASEEYQTLCGREKHTAGGDWLKFTVWTISIFYMLSLAARLSSLLWGKSVTSRCITVQRCSRGLLKGPPSWASSDCLVTACQWWAMLPLTHAWSIRAHQHQSPAQIVFLDLV